MGAIRYLIRRIVFQKTRRKYFIINEIGLVIATLVFILMFYGFSMGEDTITRLKILRYLLKIYPIVSTDIR